VPWFVYLALGLIGADQFTVRATIGQPLNATLMLAFVFALFWHAQLGLQVVVEDYVHGWLEIALQIAIKFACVLAALASAIAIGRLAFSVSNL
jgi:succinate dehydrogenase / fumarate reductase membrane anchor subunit